MSEPTTLQEAVIYFSSASNCLEYLAAKRWPNGVICPTCGSEKVKFNPGHGVWQCSKHHAKRQFSVKVGTIFEDSAIGLDKWLTAVWMLTNCKNGISSYEIGRDLGVTQKTAWFMMHRIRLALQDEKDGGKLGGEVEVDDTFIGGLSRNMHKDKREKKITGTGGKDKTPVLGFIQRGGEVRAQVIPDRKRDTLHGLVKANVAAGSALYSDALAGYEGLDREFFHQVVDHAVEYVRGNVHTDTLENFWSLLKQGIKAPYVSVEPFHLFRYLDEQSFRYNYREDLNDRDRFDLAVSQVVGKRLTWNRPTSSNVIAFVL